uniref:Very-long-chain (3R)-3-hydroxyacyl-CoA dehydratase n=1 Tax=Nothobranchius korthausae TaxID=1143690 RepID=A0A1A8F958_9TELE
MASSEEDGTVEEKENNNKKRTKSALVTAWLTFYNIAMTAGWLVLAITMMRFYIQKGTHKGLYRSIARTLKFFQTFALVEHQTGYILKGMLCTFCCRYNFFIVLYPLGVAGELLTIYAALPFVRRSGMYSMRLPNKYNVSFDYYYCLIIVMLSYIPLFPQLYLHMLRQRRRVLHGEVIVEKDE